MKNNKTLLATTNHINKTFLIAIITSIVLGLLTLITAYKTNTLNNNRVMLQNHSTSLKNASDYLTTQIRLYALTGDIKYKDNYIKETQETKTTTKSLEAIESIGITKEELNLISTSKKESDSLINQETEAMKAAEAGDLAKAKELVLGESYVSRKTIIDKYVNDFQNTLMDRANKNSSISQIILIVLNIINIFILGLILSIFSKYAKFVKNKVIKSIIYLKNCFFEISEGNLHTEINLEEDNSEIGEFATVAKKTQTMLNEYIDDIHLSLDKISHGDITFNIDREYIGDFVKIKDSIINIVDSLNEILSEINLASSHVTTSSEEIAITSSVISEGAINQAGAIEELSATINEIYNKINLTSDNSKNVNLIIEETSEKIKNSNDKMLSMLTAMENINTSSNEISKIIDTINSMSFQTNLLSVNASIEASRAGTTGKQFTVIAEEVRQLAENSSNAVKETSSLISESIIAVEEGNIIAKETASMLEAIVEEINKITLLINEISTMSLDQAIATREITKVIDDVSSVVQNNSATAEENAASSQELASQANILNNNISKFKLK